MSLSKSSMRTPLGKVRGLGSAKSGTEHFWMQRLTAFANVPLALFAIGLIIATTGANYASVKATIGTPLVAIPLILFVVSATWHMRLGMQVIIEDYVHGEGAKVLLIMLNTFFTAAIALGSIFAILKIAFGV